MEQHTEDGHMREQQTPLEPEVAGDAAASSPILPRSPGVSPLTQQDLARGDLLVARVTDFGHFLYELGMDVGPERIAEAVAGLPLIDFARKSEFTTYLKICFVTRHDQDALFDLAFSYFWRQGEQENAEAIQEALTQHKSGRSLALPSSRAPNEERARALGQRPGQRQRHPYARLTQQPRKPKDDEDDAERFGTYSREEVLRRKDFEDFSWYELQEAKALMSQMHWHLGERRTRRLRPARHGRQLDLRRTLRLSLRSGGEPTLLARRDFKHQPRPLVILCDISGSMSLYSRLLLHFVHTVANGIGNVETFVFATRLTRITRQLARRDVDAAVKTVTKSVQDWSGGTRIGESFRSFNQSWARRVLGRGAVVLIISDGWDRGDVRILDEAMARLQRNCHRLIWLNPLLGQEDYRPITAGMRTALPYLDDFLPANNLDSLFELGDLLASVDERRPQRARVVKPPRTGGQPGLQRARA